jgi:hypothetical protein
MAVYKHCKDFQVGVPFYTTTPGANALTEALGAAVGRKDLLLSCSVGRVSYGEPRGHMCGTMAFSCGGAV